MLNIIDLDEGLPDRIESAHAGHRVRRSVVLRASAR